PELCFCSSDLVSAVACFVSSIIGRPLRSPLFPTRRSSDLSARLLIADQARHRLDPHVLAVLAPQPERRAAGLGRRQQRVPRAGQDRKSTRLNSSHVKISYAVFCLKKKIIKV